MLDPPQPPTSACAATKSTTPAELAMFTATRKEAYEAKHPETVREATLKRGNESPSRQVGETAPPRFTADTAAREAGFPNNPTMRPR